MKVTGVFPLSTGFPLIRKSTSIPVTDVVPFRALPKTVMLPLPENVEVVVDFVVDVEVDVGLVIERDVVRVSDVIFDETEVVEVDTVDIDGIVEVDTVDIDGIVEVDIDECVEIEVDVVVDVVEYG